MDTEKLGLFLQITGLILVPMGLLHYITYQDTVSEAALMNWELGLLATGAICFILGRRLQKER